MKLTLLETLTLAVKTLALKAQNAHPDDRAKLYALYREAYRKHREHKTFCDEQDLVLNHR